MNFSRRCGYNLRAGSIQGRVLITTLRYFDTGLFRMGLFWFGVILAWGYFGLGLFRFGVILVWGYYGLGLFWWGYFSGVISVWGYFILEPTIP